MSQKELPEKDSLEPAESSVDFSDLGPLFAAEENPSEEEAETAADDAVVFEPDPQSPAPEPSEEEVLLNQELSEGEEEDSVTFEAQEAPNVDFSDLGPLFQENPAVQAGEAALLLKKLSEMEPAQEEIPEENLPEEAIP